MSFDPVQFVQRLQAQLDAAAIPTSGCAVLDAAAPTDPSWHVVVRADGIHVRTDYQPSATAGQITPGDEICLDLDAREYRPRLIWSVYHEIDGLSAAQKTSTWNDLGGGSPPKWAAYAGPNAADLAVLWLFSTQVAAIQTVADKRQC